MQNTLPSILAFALNDWDGPWMNRQQLLTRLAERGWPVIYSNGPLDLWDRSSSKWADSRLAHRVEGCNRLWVDRPGRLFPTWQRSRAWSSVAFKSHARHLMRAASRRGATKPIAYIFHPSFERYAASLDSAMVVYHAYDDFAQTSSWTPVLEQAERALIRRAALVIASSNGIAERLHHRHGVDAAVLLNGADAEAFIAATAQACPADLQPIAQPRIGYVGRITPKVDFALIDAMAQARRDWNFILVGPVLLGGSVNPAQESQAREAHEECRRQPNVHFLGEKNPSDLARYTGHMDVNLMCYRADGGWWSLGHPLKLHEYLASGKPVVSTPIEAVIQHEDVVALARHAQAWVPTIAQCLASDTPEARRRRQTIARQNSWEERTDQLDAYLRTALARCDMRWTAPSAHGPALPRSWGVSRPAPQMAYGAPPQETFPSAAAQIMPRYY